MVWQGSEGNDDEVRERPLLDEILEPFAKNLHGVDVYFVDRGGVIEHTFPETQRVDGYTGDHLIGSSIAEVLPAEASRDSLERALEIAAETGHATIDEWCVRPDGTRYLAAMTITAIRNGSATAPRLGVVALDITGRQRIEERLRSIVDHTNEGIVLIDESGIIQEFNRRAETMFGYPAAEVIGENVKILMPEPYRSEHDGYLTRYQRTREPHVIGNDREVVARRKDGSVFPVNLSVNEFSLDGHVYYNGMIRDLTARAVLEDQLRQAQRVDALGQLVGGIAHDFNNLLTVISGYSTLLSAGMAEDDPDRDAVEAIRVAGDRAADLTARLLAFGRRSVLQPRKLDINEVIRETEQLLRRTLGENIAVVNVLDPSIPEVEVDPGQMGQVVMNLAINARDAMPLGGQLTIRTATFVAPAGQLRVLDLQPGTYVRIAVSDNGQGMRPEVRDRVFEPFFTTKSAGMGTGLGLSVVHGIIKQSGGSITVQSQPGKGTTFAIYLPAAGSQRASLDDAQSVSTSPGSRNETILLAEDEVGVRRIIQLVLEREGYRVIPFGDGESALDALRRDPSVALVVTDIVMPGMNGRELAEQAAVIRPEIPFLFTSGYPDDSIVQHGIISSDVNFLQKPFTPNGLLAKVAAVLRK